MAYDNDRQQYINLPLINDLDTQPRQRVIALLERLDKLKEDLHKLGDEEDDILNELTRIQQETGRSGFRYGWLCFTAVKVAGRKSLDRLLLMENGCPAAVIQQSYKEGNPTTHRKFHRLKEEDLPR
jgi:hypothetical protein